MISNLQFNKLNTTKSFNIAALCGLIVLFLSCINSTQLLDQLNTMGTVNFIDNNNNITQVDYKFIKKLGKGYSGAVYLARDLTNDQEVAIKMGNLKDEYALCLKEYEIVKLLDHPNIVKTYGRFFMNMTLNNEIGKMNKNCRFSYDKTLNKLYESKYNTYMNTTDEKLKKHCHQYICTVMEAGKCDLFNITDHFKEINYAEIFRQLAKGVEYLHDNNMIHGDLKTENVIIVGKKVKIIDFNSTRKNNQPFSSALYTIYSAAPEILAGKKGSKMLTSKADVWSLAAVFFKCITGDYLFKSKDKKKKGKSYSESESNVDYFVHHWNIIGNKTAYEKHKKELGPEFCNMLKRMIKINPEERISIKEVLNCSYFTSVNAANATKSSQKHGKTNKISPISTKFFGIVQKDDAERKDLLSFIQKGSILLVGSLIVVCVSVFIATKLNSRKRHVREYEDKSESATETM